MRFKEYAEGRAINPSTQYLANPLDFLGFIRIQENFDF